MKKLIRIILPCILFLSTTAQAQKTGSISGFLMDSTANASIPGAVVEVSNVKDTLQKKYASSGYKGSFEIKGLSYGEYNLRISFLGYHDIRQTIRVNKPTLNLGTLYLVQASQRIDDIVLEVQALRTSQKGDTVVYNADAFKVTQDADAENLLSKMPGITVLDGEVEAQGETVKKVFVDGKEFFGGDVTSAIKNLPAEVIEKIEVYNKLSDRAEFTGIDDGEGYKAINLVTKVQSGQFGKLNVGYGFNDKYIGGGNLNFFKGDTRISLIGMTNNINQQNFAMEDLLGVVSSGRGMQSRGGGHMRGMRGSGSFLMRPQDGISTVTSFGVNYSDVWAKKVEVSASYFFNKTRNENEKITDRQYYSDTEAYRTYDNTSNSESKNYEHRFNARIEYKINDNQTLMIRPQASFQDYDSYNSGYGLNNEIAGSTTTLINELTNLTESKNFGYNLSNSIFYRLKLGKPGRTLMVDASGGANKNDRKGLNSTLQQNLPVLDSLFKQRTITNSNGYNLSGSVNYTEPLSEKSQLSLQYRISYSYSDADKEAFLWDRALEQFNPNFDEDYSNIYNSGYLTQRVGPGFNHSNEGNIFVANVYYQKSSLIGNQDYPTPPQKIKASFDNFLYFAFLARSLSSTGRMRIMARL